MQLVERHVISKNDPRYAIIDAAAFASKNLWNAANYLVRQAFIHERVYLDNSKVYHLIKSHEAYKALPAKVSNQVLIQLHKAWVAFFEAMEAWRQDPSKFQGRPKLPGYKDKVKGRNLLMYEKGAISKRALKRGRLSPSGLDIEIPTAQQAVKQARIVPRTGFYVVEVVYEQAMKQAEANPEYYAGIDIGMHILAALTSNKPNFQSAIINGRPLKSIMRVLMLQSSIIPAKIIVLISGMHILGERSLCPQSGWNRQKETESLKVEEVDGKKAF
jgi:putative transposase